MTDHPQPIVNAELRAPATISNFRAIGDLSTQDGNRVSSAMLYRSGHLADASDEDLDLLTRLGIRTIIDLRRPDEIGLHGIDRIPPGAELIEAPILPDDTTVQVVDSNGRQHDIDVVNLIYSDNPDELLSPIGNHAAISLMERVYELLATDEQACQQYGRILRKLAEPGSMPAVIHCTAGKDRTGWVASVVLSMLGVATDDLVEHYLDSNLQREANIELHRARWSELGVDPGLMDPLVMVRPEYLLQSYAAVASRWGTFEEYVSTGLDLGDVLVERLRSELLMPDAERSPHPTTPISTPRGENP